MGSGEKDRYLRLLNVSNESDIVRSIQELASDRDERHHIIRSNILDMHTAMEFELKRFLYHHMYSLVGIGKDAKKNEGIKSNLTKAINRMSFSEVYRVLRPVFDSWPFGDLESIRDVNDIRNQVAHRTDPAQLQYKGRSPFEHLDCFAQIYFDVWSITQQLQKLFERVITMPQEELKRLRSQIDSR